MLHKFSILQGRFKPLSLAIASIFLLSGGVAYADAPFDAAVAKFKKGDFKTAAAEFSTILKKSPSNVNVLYYCALCCQQMRNQPLARQYYKRIIDLEPASAAAGYAKTALENLDKAAEPASKAAAVATAGANAKTVGAPGDTTSATAPAGDAASEDAEDISGLPDTASFYFVKESGGHMAVDITVNGHPMRAWFDTGANAFFYKDQLTAAGVNCNSAKPSGFTAGWAGKKVPISSMMAQVRLGNLTRKIKISIEDSNSGLEKNLVGQTLISGYQYEIDDKANRVDLHKAIATAQTVDPLYDIPCTPVHGRDILQVEINGRRVNAFIDTGSFCTILDAKTAESCGVEVTGTQQLVGVGGELSVGTGTAKIRLGGIRRDDFPVRIGGKGGCCIGQDFMEGWRCKIDRQRNLLRLFH